MNNYDGTEVEQDVHQEIKKIKVLLEQSSVHLNPAVNAKLNAARSHAMDSLDSSAFNFSTLFKPFIAFMLPLFVVALVMIYPTPHENIQTSDDIYADFEFLMDEEELDFLSDLELSEWADNSN